MEEDEIERVLREVEEGEDLPRPEDDLPEADWRKGLSYEDRLERCGPPRLVFRTKFMKGVRFECRPISKAPPAEETVSLLYRRDGDYYRPSGVAVFKGGVWLDDKRQMLSGDLLWTAMVDER
jgi:hypothetical protein